MNNEFVYEVISDDFSIAGQVSSNIKNILRKIGVEKNTLRHISIASYEAEINMIIHSNGGEMTLIINDNDITVICKDLGPGIADIDLAMKEGFSTASDQARTMGFGAGMGLANMKKCSDDFDIKSTLGVGTTITMMFKI